MRLGTVSRGVVAILALCLMAGAASAKSDIMKTDSRQRHGCNQLVNLAHPDFKGATRKAEFDRCMADPDAYSKR